MEWELSRLTNSPSKDTNSCPGKERAGQSSSYRQFMQLSNIKGSGIGI